MKSKQTPVIVGIIFICLCLIPLMVAGVGYLYMGDQPPNRLEDSGYYIRRTKVYYYPGFGLSEPFEIQGADKNSFIVVDESYAYDKSYVYFDGFPIPEADSKTFRVLNENYYCSADANHAYQRDNIIPNFDPNSIPANATVTYCSPDEILFAP